MFSKRIPARVGLVVDVSRGAFPVCLRAPAPAVVLVPDLVAALHEAGGLGLAVGALATAEVRAEILKRERGMEEGEGAL